jgi:hypothetical protein
MAIRDNSIVVCAANRNSDGLIVAGARHYDDVMRAQIKSSTGNWRVNTVEQGFIDQFGNFLTRQEAWGVAFRNNQITRRCGGDESGGGTLYSENLY